jgi:hypothetical protein
MRRCDAGSARRRGGWEAVTVAVLNLSRCRERSRDAGPRLSGMERGPTSSSALSIGSPAVGKKEIGTESKAMAGRFFIFNRSSCKVYNGARVPRNQVCILNT